jgi:hypothetical protein
MIGAHSQTPEFSFKHKAPGNYVLKAFRGVTKDVRAHLRHLLSRAPRFIWVNGHRHSKKQAFSIIVELLAQHQTVEIHV